MIAFVSLDLREIFVKQSAKTTLETLKSLGSFVSGVIGYKLKPN